MKKFLYCYAHSKDGTCSKGSVLIDTVISSHVSRVVCPF